MTALSIQPTFPTFTGADGQPLENGYIWVGTANLNPITNPITVYWDAALSAPATQPIRTLGGYPSNSGTPARLYVNSDYSIQVLDRKGSVVYSAPVATDRYGGGIINANIVVYDPSGTGAVATTVQAKLRENITDSGYSTLQAAVTAAAGKRLTIYGSWTVTTPVTVASNTEIVLAPGSLVTTATANISVFSATSATDIKISGPGSITKTGTGTDAYVGLVIFETCTYCTVERVNFSGMQWSGVLLSNSSYCTVRGNRFSGVLGSVQDSADIHVFRTSQFNVIDGNFCYGDSYAGVFIQDPGSSLIPSRNVVCNNRIGAHTAYGILQYNIDSSDSFTQIIGNFIEGITGVYPSGSGGAGIYVTNSGGVSVIGNTIRNCCISTSNETLAPAGIGISNLGLALTGATVCGNSITDIVNYSGINVSSSLSGAVVSGNTIKLTNNTGSSTKGIYINASSYCSVTGNKIDCSTSANTTGISIYANGVDTASNTVTGNSILGCGYAGFRVFGTAACSNKLLTITGNSYSNGGASSIPYRLSAMSYSLFSGNTGSAGSPRCVDISGVSQTTFSGNMITSTGTQSVVTAGTCTGSMFDKSNYVGTNYQAIQNAGTGMIFEFLGNAQPLASNWAVGDRVEQSVPVVGSAKGWRCTVAGVPGTWVSEGNL